MVYWRRQDGREGASGSGASRGVGDGGGTSGRGAGEGAGGRQVNAHLFTPSGRSALASLLSLHHSRQPASPQQQQQQHWGGGRASPGALQVGASVGVGGGGGVGGASDGAGQGWSPAGKKGGHGGLDADADDSHLLELEDEGQGALSQGSRVLLSPANYVEFSHAVALSPNLVLETTAKGDKKNIVDFHLKARSGQRGNMSVLDLASNLDNAHRVTLETTNITDKHGSSVQCTLSSQLPVKKR